MSPADIAIKTFVTRTEVARICGVSQSAITIWTRARRLGGCGGDIPHARYARALIAAAKKRGLDLTPDDMLYGRRRHAVA